MTERKPLETNIADYRADFESVRGKPFDHFFCPILHVDEEVPLTKGHIVPKSLGGKAKVLQRRDVDNGFGSFFEAEAGDAVLHGLDGDLFDVVSRGDPDEMKKIGRRFDIRIQLEGVERPIDVFHRKVGDVVELVVAKDDLRKALGDFDKPPTARGRWEVELDARSSILATSLRTSHLCWFQKCGYRYVFSNGGIFVAWVLRSFFESFILPRHGPDKTKKGSLASNQVKRKVNDHCFQFANFIRPYLPSVDALPEEIARGTLNSGQFIALWDGDQVYGQISIVKFANQRIAVMAPTVTDERGWALLDLAANLELEFSLARWDAEAGVFRVDPPTGQTLIWTSVDEKALSLPPISIRQAAAIVNQSGRMNHSVLD